ncbi:hypothetical protein LLEC1_07239 [Akanthomyces lecanii]|uniref:CDP-diacylglycerol--glycerol-3-phosphate 3-phosphatidyltransferase n=1 Tax=Cordyceps confragosa TaxID=2714763 RepID=A0A179I212_CORDF|nr:hypothetical protein LLEC1_07239 [Akanthomyces lecanii]
MLAPFVTELDKLAPSVDLRGDQIQILKTPSDFYETLKERIRNAKSRIFLSTLYIGKSERELIETLQEALRRNPELKLSILTDCLRGTREAPNASCASLLAPLVTEFGADRVEIRMYHTPNLTGLREKYIPKRINEGWGLQHMKLYGVDDEIIMSGANLSTDYFTNRQDRYHLFKSKQVTDHFWNIHNGVSSFSFLSPGVSGLLPDAYTLLAKRFVHAAHHRGRGADITLREWRSGTVGQPGGWTYHAKGLWVAMPGDAAAGPSMSVIGSSNYTKRSYSHDLEVGALIVTRDAGLKSRLKGEQEWLQEHARTMTREDFSTNERRVGLKVRIAMWIVSLVGGAL